MTLFITSIIITVAMLIEKLYFFKLEISYSLSNLGSIEMIFYIITMFVAVVLFFRQFSSRKTNNVKSNTDKFFNSFNTLVLFFMILTAVFICLSFYLNFVKESIHWDAVALYDARAKFLQNGMLFSNMPLLAKYDNLNQYYYLLYPPYTSIAHFMWRALSITKLIPVSVYYSVVFVLLISQIFTVGKERFGLLIGIIIAFLVASNTSIFNVVIKEYTNLPFDLYIISGVLLLYSYLKKGELWKYLLGVLMVSSSLWIRLLEPIWLAITIAFLFALIQKHNLKKAIILSSFLLFSCLLEYYAWNYFTNSIAHNPGFLNFTKTNIADTFVAFFTGAPLIVGVNIVKSWGIPVLIHFAALTGLILRFKYSLQNKPLLFLGGIILVSILIYFAEFYVISFQADWWSIVTMSIDRSSTFLIPISTFVLFDLLTSSKMFNRSN